MAGQSFSTATRTNKVTLATGHAGERDGTNATDGAAGTAAGSILKSIDIACTDSATVANTLRIYRNENGTKSLIRSFPIGIQTFVNGQFGDYTAEISLMKDLAGTTSKLAYALESNMGLVITENFADF